MKSIISIITMAILALQTLNAQQEKRLALVIGNANYDKGALDNPVNDALLMEKTLKSLDFDVILDTNIATLQEFNSTVRKFGDKRDEYNVGFIYYAGHGVQINGENYLLATKEKYASEYDVDDNALSVQKIMRFLTNKTNQVNVLILDACRDNPFEKNWNPQARSSDGGRGLAKIPPPTGSLIAFSTDAGNTAADGEGKNSIYCLSLAKNMQLENTTLDQVFRNVRTDVLKASNNTQRPVEASQLTGEAFYLKKGTYTNELILIDSLIEEKQYEKGLEIAISILNDDKKNKSALIRKGRLYSFLYKNDLAEEDLNLANELYPNDVEILFYRGRFFNAIKEFDKALLELNKAIDLDSTYTEAYQYRAIVYVNLDELDDALVDNNKTIELEKENPERYLYRAFFHQKYSEDFDQALLDYKKAIELDPNNPSRFEDRAKFYTDYLKDYDKAFKDYSKAIELDPNNPKKWFERGRFSYVNYNNNDLAFEDFKRALEIDPSHAQTINAIGVIYMNQGKYDLALEQYEKGIALIETNTWTAALCYRNRADLNIQQEKYQEAYSDYSNAIELYPNYADFYSLRAYLSQKYLKDYNEALINYSKVIELEPNDPDNFYERSYFYRVYLKDDESAVKDLQSALEIDPSHVNSINWLGTIYSDNGQLQAAIDQFEKGMKYEKSNPKSVAFCYYNRANIYEEQNRLQEAENDYSKAIELDPNNPNRYEHRAEFYTDYYKDYDKALKDYSKAIELDPNNPKKWFERGRFIYYYYENSDLAVKDFKRALEIDPSHAQTINAIGVVHMNREEYDLAIEQYNKGIAFVETNTWTAALCYSNRASIYTKQQKYQEAYSDYSSAIELYPKRAANYEERAYLLQDYFKDYNAALIDFSKVVELEPNDPQHWYNRGYLFKWYLNDYESALNDYQNALTVDATFVDAINAIGTYYHDNGELQKAIEQYEKGMSLEKSDPVAAAFCYYNRANIYEEQNRLQEAENDYTKAIELDPNNPKRFRHRADFYTDHLQDYDKALKDFSKAIELDPNNPENWYERGRFIFINQKENIDLSIKDFKRALELDSSHPESINAIGVVHMDREEYDLAIEQYNKGIALVETNTWTAALCYNNRASIYIKQQKYQEALADYGKAIELQPKHTDYYEDRAYLLQDHFKDYNAALIDLSKVVELQPNDPTKWYNRGYFYQFYLEDEESALNDYQNAIKIDPSYIDALNTIGTYYHNNGELQKAIEQYEKGMTREKSDPVAAAFCYYNRARLYAEQRRIEEAEKDYTKAIELDPNNPKRFRHRADFYIDYLKDYDKALKDFSKVIEIDPNNSKRYVHRADFYEDYLKDYDNAFKDYSKAIELDPNNPENWYQRGRFIHTKYEKSELAFKDFKRALEIDPSHAKSINALGLMFMNLGEYDLAIEQYTKGISLIETNTWTASLCYRNRADLYVKQQKYEEAYSDYSSAIELYPKNVGHYLFRAAFLREHVKDYNAALIDLSKVVELKPNDPKHWYSRGYLFQYYLGDEESALNDYKNAIKTDSTYIPAITAIGTYYHDKGELQMAIEQYEKGMTLEKSNPRNAAFCYYNRARIYAEQNRLQEAEKDYTKAIELDPNDPNRYSQRALFYSDYLNDYDKAINDYAKAIKINPERANYYFARANLYLKMNSVSLAEKDFNFCVKLFPEHPYYYAERGFFYVQVDKYDKANIDFNKVIELDSTYRNVYYHRSKMYTKLKQFDKAKQDYLTSIELDKNDPEGFFYLGKFYDMQGNYFKALKNYNLALAKLGGELDYYISLEDGSRLPESGVHTTLGELYIKVDEREMACEEYQKALELIKKEDFNTKQEKQQRDIEEKVKSLCN